MIASSQSCHGYEVCQRRSKAASVEALAEAPDEALVEALLEALVEALVEDFTVNSHQSLRPKSLSTTFKAYKNQHFNHSFRKKF